MDHLPRPSQPHQPLSVRYFFRKKDEEYDHAGFEGYPARRSVDVNKLKRGDLQDQSIDYVCNFLQQWLYFGVLEEVFKICAVDFNPGEFVRDHQSESGRPGTSLFSGSIDYNVANEIPLCITTQVLPEKLRQWKVNESLVSSDIKYDHGKMIDAILDETDHVLGIFAYNQLTLLEASSALAQVCPEDLEISIRILIDTLTGVGWTIYGNAIQLHGEKRNTNHAFFRRLASCGWCPGFLHPLKRAFLDPTFLYYASTVGPSRANKDHSRCSETNCFVNQIDNEDYETKHIVTGKANAQGDSIDPLACDCPTICANLSELNEIIKAGGTPLISVRWPQPSEGNGNLQDLNFKLVRHRKEIQYIAFSHVWSDGLGNPNENGLPQCQLRRLRDLLWSLRTGNTVDPGNGVLTSKLNLVNPWMGEIKTFPADGQLYFWLDTFCVPVPPKKGLDKTLENVTRKSRDMAIKSINRTFQNAECILVLDSDLLECIMALDPLELLTKFLFSGWQSRLWTLQEGVMANATYIQFRDGAKELTAMLVDLMNQNQRGVFQSTPLMPNLVMREVSNFGIMQGHIKGDPFVAAMTATRTRSTSKASDEAICLASIFHLNLDEIMDPKPEQQWHMLLRAILKMTTSSLFFDCCRKSDEEGYRWAPKTFLTPRNIGQCSLLRFNASRPKVELTDTGLNITCMGIMFDPPKKPLSKYFTMEETSSEKSSHVQMNFDPNNSKEEDRQHLETIRPAAQSSLALILEKPLSTGLPIRAALVDRCQHNAEHINARYLTAATVTGLADGHPMDKYYPNYVDEVSSYHEDSDPNYSTYLKGASTPENQKWCIG